MRLSTVLGLLGAAGHAFGDPTWPSAVDELEEIMFQLTSFRARKFAGPVSPCTNEASGPGRQNAAEWLRTAFHDMSTANTFFGIGGMDGSLQYELKNGENTGPGFRTTLEFLAPYMNRKATLADLLALSVYTSVRSCGGPAVPVRAGRVDATSRGSTGVPQPQNSILTFQQQFQRMGFTNQEMIQVTACGHTLGGVHAQEFPDILPVGSRVNDFEGLDSSVAVFDNKVVTEYLDGTSKNPLLGGPAANVNKHSDFKVFNSDRNATMQAMTGAEAFRNVCKSVLQKMIDVVPAGVTLSDPIVPYQVKPVNLQLSLATGGTSLRFTGFIRVRTTNLPRENIANVVLTYKNRNGGSQCGSGPCTITTTIQGVSQGFDDTFAFFPIDANIPASVGISSFIVTVNQVDGTSTLFDNNGESYPIQDGVLLQVPQSCLLGSSGALTVVAAVRNDRVDDGAVALVTFKTPQTRSPVPLLQEASVTLQKGRCVGAYTLFSATYTIQGGLAYESRIDVKNGDLSDSFRSVNDIGGTCRAFANPAVCNAAGASDSTSAAGTPTASSTTLTSVTSTLLTTPSTTPAPSASSISSALSSASPIPSPYHRESVGGYLLVSCWSEGAATRALSGDSYVDAEMTLEKCEEFCSDYVYWGTEFGQECYCGNSLSSSSDAVPIDDCNMACGGDASQYCGAGNRLELYSTTAAVTISSTSTSATPVPTPVHRDVVGKYNFVGCWKEAVGGRALTGPSTASADMTNEQCATFCSSFKYFGTEYASECYCGDYLATSSESAPLEDCSMTCSGDASEFCGAGNRLELYMDPNATGGPPEQPAAAGDFVWLGCQTEGTAGRALASANTADGSMTNELCAEFCADYEYFGTEYSSECFCGNVLGEGSVEAPGTDCTMLCSGSASQYCGGPNRLSTYIKRPAPASE
ncbi:WSC domain-containing protein [Paramyrothecium foliicola]|nr:WSC domain-containing protein [Paramyrothecium foliicola]